MQSAESRLKPQDAGAPGQAAAHGLQQQQVARLDAAVLRRPASRASGIEAAEVLACSATVEITLSSSMPSRLADALEDALVGLVRDEPVDVGDRRRPASAAAAVTASEMLTTAWRNTWLPCMRRWPTVPVGGDAAVDVEQVLLGPVAAQGEAQQAAVGRGPLALRRGSSTTAPAPSPNSTQVPRSVQSISRVMVSAPMTRAHFERPRATKPSATRQGVDEARADRLHVEGDADRRSPACAARWWRWPGRSGPAWWWRR